MKDKMKKFGAWLLAAYHTTAGRRVAAAMVCALAFAGAGVAKAETVMTESDLTAAITAGGTVTLGADISLSQEVEVGTTVTLDLSTYRVTAAAGANAFQVVSNGNFTINADATNPGGITTDDDRCCVYTSYGWHPGPKSVTINGGSFFGNFVFNWSPDIDARAAAEYGLTQGGGGSGSKADPTSVVINGGTFDGGANDGNVAEYRCYYFTVNGGTFEKGLDCADTETCSIGVTSTCKAFFKGGKYRIRYPYWRETSSGRESPAKVVIGDGYTDYVHVIDGDYYAIAPDASGCVQESRYACSVAVYSPIVHFVRQVWQHWTFETKTWYVKQSPDSSNLANGVSTLAPLRLMKTAVPNKLASASPLLAAQPSPQLLSESSAQSEPTVYVNTENGLHEVFLKTYEEVTSALGEKVKNTTAGHKTRFIDEKDFSYDLEQSDFDAAYVFEYDTGIDVLEIVSLVDKYTGKPVDDEARVKLRQMLSLSDDSTDDQIAIAVFEALQAATSGSAPSPYANDPYLEWKTDFVMSFDKPVNAGTVRFLHDRDVNGDASEIFDNPALEAGAYATVFDYTIMQPTWGGVVDYQQCNDQLIGLRNLSEDNYGTTVTVALRHISPDGDHSKDVIRASYSYTFPEPPARIVNVTTTAEAQAALDAAQKGDTIVFAAGDYGTIYIRNNGEDANRILENVTLVAAENAEVTVDEFYHQYVGDKSLDVENLVIDGFTFDDPTVPAVNFDVSGNSSTSGRLRVNGLTVKNCTKVGNNATAAAAGQSSYNEPRFVVFHYDSATPPTVYAGDPSLQCGYHDIQILSNTITQVCQPICFPNSGILNGLTVVGNTFTDCTDNHIQKSGDQTSGAFIVKDNVIVNMSGRFARIAGATADATFTIENNTVTTPKKYDAGGDPDIFKITGAAGFTVTEKDNQWLDGSFNEAKTTWIAAGDPSLLPVTAVAEIFVGDESKGKYETLDAAIKAAAAMDQAEEKVIELQSCEITESIKLPATLKNVTFRGQEDGTSVLKDMTINSSDGSEYTYENIWFDGVVFENSRMIITGGRTGTEVNKNWKFTGNTFRNLTQQEYSYLHFASLSNEEPAENFTFTGNVVDGSTYGSAAALNISSVTGNIDFKNNEIKNLLWRPMNIQINNHDGVADVLTVTGNKFGTNGSAPQMLTKFADGYDSLTARINQNIFGGNIETGFILAIDNPQTLDGDVTHNYYSSATTRIYIPNKYVYFNSDAAADLPHADNTCFSYYTGLTEGGEIDPATLVEVKKAVAQIVDTGATYPTLAAAVAAVPTDGTEATTIKMLANETMPGNNGVTIPDGKDIVLDLNGFRVCNDASESNYSATITIAANGKLTVKDTSDDANGVIINAVAEGTNGDWGSTPRKNWASNTVVNHGTFILESGNIVNTTEGISYCVDNNSNVSACKFVMNGGKLYNNYGDQAVRLCAISGSSIDQKLENRFEMHGGEIVTGGFWVQMAGAIGGDFDAAKNWATVIIDGGTVNGFIDIGNQGTCDVEIGGKAVINASKMRFRSLGGADKFVKFIGGKISIPEFDDQTAADYFPAVVSGGVFTESAKTGLANYVAEGHAFVENTDPDTSADYPWTIGEVATEVAAVISADGTTTNKFETLQAAVAAASDGDTVKLLANIDLPEGTAGWIGKGNVNLTIDGAKDDGGRWAIASGIGNSNLFNCSGDADTTFKVVNCVINYRNSKDGQGYVVYHVGGQNVWIENCEINAEYPLYNVVGYSGQADGANNANSKLTFKNNVVNCQASSHLAGANGGSVIVGNTFNDVGNARAVSAVNRNGIASIRVEDNVFKKCTKSGLIAVNSGFDVTLSLKGNVYDDCSTVFAAKGATTTFTSDSEIVGVEKAIDVSSGAAVAISGGKYAGSLTNSGTITLTGGVYVNEPDHSYAAEGYEVQANAEPFTKDDYPWAVDKKAFVPADENPITIDITPAGGTQAIVPVTVSEDAVKAMVNAGIVTPAGEKATAAEVSDGLAQKQNNDQTVWQNYVMGIDGTTEQNMLATIGEKRADKPEEVVVVKTPITEFNPPQNTGVTVTYNLLRKRPGETKFSVFQEGLLKPEVDVNTIELDVGDTLWKFEAVFSAEKP